MAERLFLINTIKPLNALTKKSAINQTLKMALVHDSLPITNGHDGPEGGPEIYASSPITNRLDGPERPEEYDGFEKSKGSDRTDGDEALETPRGLDKPEEHASLQIGNGLDEPQRSEEHVDLEKLKETDGVDGPDGGFGLDGVEKTDGENGPEAHNAPERPQGHFGLNGQDETKEPNLEKFLSSIGDNKNVPWYKKELGTIEKPARELLEKYSKIPAEKVDSHILEVRDRAWEVAPYPCIGTFLFLDLSIAKSTRYPELVTRIKNGQKLLDVGCCFAQDLRKLVHDGAPSDNLWGTDILGGFIDLGYELFLDKDTFRCAFLVADALDPESSLKQLDGQIDIIYAGFFFHLFDWEQQVRVAERLIRILKPAPGSLILGKQTGLTKADTELLRFKGAGAFWRHNAESFARMWNEAGERTGTKWIVNTALIDEGASKEAWVKMNTQWVTFEIERTG